MSRGDGHGIQGAELTFVRDGGATSIESGPEGEFSFQPAASGRYVLIAVTAAGHLPFAPAWGQSPIAFLARPKEQISGAIITLDPAVRYTGRVLSPAGEPVAGATVRLIAGGEGPVPIDDRFESGTDGTFTFRAPPDAVLEATHAGYAPGRARLGLSEAITRRVTIRLRSADEGTVSRTVHGRVVDPDGEPLAEAAVSARAGGHGAEVETQTDAEGQFALEGLLDEEYEVQASHHDFVPAEVTGIRPPAKVTLKLGRGARLVGRVTRKGSDEPVTGFLVTIGKQQGAVAVEPYRTQVIYDSSGHYQIDGVGRGTYDVMILADGCEPGLRKDVAVDPALTGEVTVDFELDRGGEITGRVVEAEGGAPIGGAAVSREGPMARAVIQVTNLGSTVTAADGTFTLSGLAAGPHSISVSAEHHHARIISAIQVEPGETTGPISVSLTRLAEGEDAKLELVGIGAALAADGDVLVINAVIPGGGAAEVGLAPGMRILAIDGTSVAELGFAGCIERIRGLEGTTVLLTVENEHGTRNLSVPRRKIVTAPPRE